MDGVGWRECVDCSETKISPDEPAWKVRCTACWQNNIKRKT
jgi:ribosomal protein S27E